MSWTLRPTIAPGEYPRGDEMETILDQIDSLTAPGWTTYTPTWTSTGSAPTLGNATIRGRYRRSVDMDLVIVEFAFIFGSTSAAGTGAWRFSLPVTASAAALDYGAGTGYILDSGTEEMPAASRVLTTTTVGVYSEGGSGAVGAGVPITWATNDQVRFTVMYEPA